MMKSLKIALLQAATAGSLENNLKKGFELCKAAKAGGADIALFPEMWSNGYDICGRTAEQLSALSVPREGAFCAAFSAAARQLGMAVGVTLLEKTDGAPKNSFVLFDRFGNAVLSYSKVHTCDFGCEGNLSRGNDFPVCTLNTAAGDVNVGAMICFDREFPESARILMLRGAELILVPNACPMEVNRLAQLRARAFENMVAVATCNYPAGVPDCNGHSTMFSGIAFEERDMCLLEAPEGEGVYFAELDLAALRTYRSAEVHGNAYRRPGLYGDILSQAVKPPFVRGDARR